MCVCHVLLKSYLLTYLLRSVVQYGSQGQSGQAIKMFQAPRKITSTLHFRHKFFILDNVKLAELSDIGFE